MSFRSLNILNIYKVSNYKNSQANLANAHLEESELCLNVTEIITKNFIPNGSVGIELDYGLDRRGSRVRVPEGAGNFPLHHRVQNGSGAHPASYPMGTRGSFPGGKAGGTLS
jgi:hypothetical protein